MPADELERQLERYRELWRELILKDTCHPDPETDVILHLHLLCTAEYDRFCRLLVSELSGEDPNAYLYLHTPRVEPLAGREVSSTGWAYQYAVWQIHREEREEDGLNPKSDQLILRGAFEGHSNMQTLNTLLAFLISEEGAFPGQREVAQGAIFEYLCFFYRTFPSATQKLASDVRTVWETHLLFSRDYRKFCLEVHGEMVHYMPADLS